MKKIQTIVLIYFLISVTITLAQSNTVTTGSDDMGSGGKLSYSIGQIDYQTNSGTNGLLTQGVQQPYEIIVITGIEKTDINLSATVYPNPTSDFIVLSVQEVPETMTYILFDVAGKLMLNQKINNKQTSIAVSDLSNGIYFLKIHDKNTLIKTFKININK